jgi:hypothetical protein
MLVLDDYIGRLLLQNKVDDTVGKTFSFHFKDDFEIKSFTLDLQQIFRDERFIMFDFISGSQSLDSETQFKYSVEFEGDVLLSGILRKK